MDTKTGKVEHPVIPLLGSAAQEVRLPHWPRISEDELKVLRGRIEGRFDAVVPRLVRAQTTSRVLHRVLGFAVGRFRPRVLDYVRDAILSDLVRRDQIEGWELPGDLARDGRLDDARAVLAELAKPTFDFRTVPGIAAATELPANFVEEVLRHALAPGNAKAPWAAWESDHLSVRRGAERAEEEEVVDAAEADGLPLYTLRSRRPRRLRRQPGLRSLARWLSKPAED